jgi:hypothetical protein
MKFLRRGMEFSRRLLVRVSNFVTRRSADERLREEIAGHLALQIEENLHAGMPPAEARRQAALKLGSAAAIQEDHHAEQSLPLIENLLFDLRYAVRMLLRSPGFSLSLRSRRWRWASELRPRSIA